MHSPKILEIENSCGSKPTAGNVPQRAPRDDRINPLRRVKHREGPFIVLLWMWLSLFLPILLASQRIGLLPNSGLIWSPGLFLPSIPKSPLHSFAPEELTSGRKLLNALQVGFCDSGVQRGPYPCKAARKPICIEASPILHHHTLQAEPATSWLRPRLHYDQ